MVEVSEDEPVSKRLRLTNDAPRSFRCRATGAYFRPSYVCRFTALIAIADDTLDTALADVVMAECRRTAGAHVSK